METENRAFQLGQFCVNLGEGKVAIGIGTNQYHILLFYVPCYLAIFSLLLLKLTVSTDICNVNN